MSWKAYSSWQLRLTFADETSPTGTLSPDGRTQTAPHFPHFLHLSLILHMGLSAMGKTTDLTGLSLLLGKSDPQDPFPHDSS